MINTTIIIAFILLLAICSYLTVNSVKIFKIRGGEIQFLDHLMTNYLRGIAILIIMTGHISGTMNTVIFTPLGGIGVSLFLFMSGYGLMLSYYKNSLSQYWWKKVNRVLIPYAVVITIISISRDSFSWPEYLLNITGIRTSYWYIGYAMKWYLIFWVVMKLFRQYQIAAMIVIGTTFLFILPDLEAEQSFSFVVGVAVARQIDKLRMMTAKKMVIIAIVYLFIGTAALALKQLPEIRQFNGTWLYSLVQLFIKLPYAIAIIYFTGAFPKIVSNPFLVFTGTISYELYLVHMPFYGYVGGSVPYALLLIIGSIGIAYIFNKLNYQLTHLSNKVKKASLTLIR